MDIIAPELAAVSPQQLHEHIITQTKTAVFDDIKQYPHTFDHIIYFINAVVGSDNDTERDWVHALKLALDSMDKDCKYLLEQLWVNQTTISDDINIILRHGKISLCNKILEEFKHIPEFKTLIDKKLWLPEQKKNEQWLPEAQTN
jgi:hypothetical protein